MRITPGQGTVDRRNCCARWRGVRVKRAQQLVDRIAQHEERTQFRISDPPRPCESPVFGAQPRRKRSGAVKQIDQLPIAVDPGVHEVQGKRFAQERETVDRIHCMTSAGIGT